MPRSKNPDMYPPAIDAILRAAVDNSLGVHPSFPTRQAAMKMRAQIYAYINALAKRESDAHGFIPDGSPSNQYRQIQITPEGVMLHLLDKQFTPEVMALTAALEQAGASAPLTRSQEIDAAMASELNAPTVESFELAPDALKPRRPREGDMIFTPAEPATPEEDSGLKTSLASLLKPKGETP